MTWTEKIYNRTYFYADIIYEEPNQIIMSLRFCDRCMWMPKDIKEKDVIHLKCLSKTKMYIQNPHTVLRFTNTNV